MNLEMTGVDIRLSHDDEEKLRRDSIIILRKLSGKWKLSASSNSQ